jgi:hypothetical protein
MQVLPAIRDAGESWACYCPPRPAVFLKAPLAFLIANQLRTAIPTGV